MVPKDWEVEKFGNLFSVKSGFGFKHAEYTDIGTPLVKIDNVSHGYVKWDNISYLPDSYQETYSDIVLKENDILLALNRPITRGMLKIVKLSASDVPSILYQRVGRIDFKSENLDRDFYFYLLNTAVFRFVSRKSIGSDQPFISTTELKKLSIVKPPLSEQQKIAKILSTWDMAISTTERLIDNSTQQKKALMQQLLTGKKRLLDESGKRFEGEWEKHSLREIVSITYGKSPKEIFCDSGKYDVIGTGGITGRTNDVLCDKTAVVLGRKGTIDKPQLITSPFWAIDTTFYCCPKNEEIDITWFFYLSKILNLRSYNEASGVPSLSRETLYSISVRVPKHIEQQKIATVLTNADKEIELLEQQLADLQQEKKALMQQLLTGKKRVKLKTSDLNKRPN